MLAYSPQAFGFLTGKIRSLDDLPADDFRRHFDRFQPEVFVLGLLPAHRSLYRLTTVAISVQNFHHNLTLVDRLTEIAKNKGVTPGQLCIAWVASLGPHMLPLPGSS